MTEYHSSQKPVLRCAAQTLNDSHTGNINPYSDSSDNPNVKGHAELLRG